MTIGTQVPWRGRSRPRAGASGAESLLHEGRDHDRAGRIGDAIARYEEAVHLATEEGESAVLSEALRRLSVLKHRRQETAEARQLCQRGHDVAAAAGNAALAGEALNSLAIFDLEEGHIERARETFRDALDVGGTDVDLRGRIEQNLGIIANIRGDLGGALGHYTRSLEAFRAVDDQRGCAIAYHNLGMISSDQERWDEADAYFRESKALADAVGDVLLCGLCLLNHTEVFVARQRYDDAQRNAQEALRIFDQLGAVRHKADAYRVLGIVYRETSRPVLAEARLRSAVDLAVTSGHMLAEAEASRELGRLYQDLNRNQDALTFLNTAHRLFGRLDAKRDLVDVASKRDELERIYLDVVRSWGQSIESADSYTFGHSERVATYALRVARELGLDEVEQTTVRIGAYLHDVGKVRVPDEILNKPGRLTRDERELMQRHPIHGVELLAGIEFPWDIKPIIRWHHEHHDGSGYPDRLCGEEIPVHAQIICIADVYDALTTGRSYRPALPREQAIDEMRSHRQWWCDDVFEAFLRAT
jgi:putative nucleotidyltransferase with HDIG domain